MLTVRIFIGLILAFAASGCASRPLYDAAGAAGGGVLAHTLSDGDPLITGAGAAGGALIAEGVQMMGDKSRKSAFTSGYDKGRSDAVKQQYWLMQRAQSETETTTRLRTYTVEGRTVTQTPDGDIQFVPHDIVIPILE